MPKAGSTTLHIILEGLSKMNKFNYQKFQSSHFKSATSDCDAKTAYVVEKELFDRFDEQLSSNKPNIILMHHYTVNQTKFRQNNREVALINVIRDPISWFQSKYYFRRLGRKATKGNKSTAANYDKKLLDQTIDECVLNGDPECHQIKYSYLGFICGEEKLCDCQIANGLTSKYKYAEIAKRSKDVIKNDYFFIGILEEFDKTLLAFEKILPHYFRNVHLILNKKSTMKKTEKTKTYPYQKMSNSTREFFLNGPLRYEYDVYMYAKSLFYDRLRLLDIE